MQHRHTTATATSHRHCTNDSSSPHQRGIIVTPLFTLASTPYHFRIVAAHNNTASSLHHCCTNDTSSLHIHTRACSRLLSTHSHRGRASDSSMPSTTGFCRRLTTTQNNIRVVAEQTLTLINAHRDRPGPYQASSYHHRCQRPHSLSPSLVIGPSFEHIVA